MLLHCEVHRVQGIVWFLIEAFGNAMHCYAD